MELSALGAFVGNAVIGGGVGVQGHGIRVNGQDIVGRNAGAVLQGFYPGFCRRQKGMGSTLFPAGAQIKEVRVFFPSGEVIIYRSWACRCPVMTKRTPASRRLR